MADCSEEFFKYNNLISLSPTEYDYLLSAQQAIERKIEKYFNEDNQYPKVEFIGQGSFSMGTIVKPLKGDYDIDVGVYLRGYTRWKSSWPTPEKASEWLVNALKNHTSTPPRNKRACVRIEYKPVTNNKEVAYHVDLPIYCEYNNLIGSKITKIGIIGENDGWFKSDPVGLTNWFLEKCQESKRDDEQLIRLVKYIKAWKDFKSIGSKFPSGMALTILMAENYRPDERDDVSFKETIRYAFNNHFNVFQSDSIEKPVEPGNNVLERLTQIQLKNFISSFETLVDDAILAVKENDKEKALRLWKLHFDERM
jgi:hypothetical protein